MTINGAFFVGYGGRIVETLSDRLRGNAPALEDMREQAFADDIYLAADLLEKYEHEIKKLKAQIKPLQEFWDGMWEKLGEK